MLGRIGTHQRVEGHPTDPISVADGLFRRSGGVGHPAIANF